MTAIRKSIVVAGAVAVLVVLVVALSNLVGGTTNAEDASGTPSVTAPAAQDELSRAIARAQQRLESNPRDYRTWAELGSAYVEQARITVDSSYYPKAEGALQTSLDLNDTSNDVALTGMGLLANARHEFPTAADWARRSLEVNPAGATTYGVLADALTQLGDYGGATEAVQQMLDLRPGIPAFTRASYDLELHGNIDGARSALEQALAEAYSPADVAFCRTYLGYLSFSQGDLDSASEEYELGLQQSPGDALLLIGQARVAAARGEEEAAVAAYQEVVTARPRPEFFSEFGEYLVSLGRTEEADEQFGVFRTVQRLFAANGVRDSLTLAYVEADFGDPAAAVEAGQAEWALRENVDAADALAWALHSAGRDAEALSFAQRATAIGGRNALFIYHRGIIEQALGRAEQARQTLDSALDINPYFSPLHAPRAKEALAAVGGPL
ncbi:MAG: tetratricopeptide repeat protein [Geodermatophilaceae bacterium]